MTCLLDTDILLDVALNRAPHAEAAARLLDALQRRPGTAFMAWHSASNFYYLVSSGRGKQDAMGFIRDLLAFVGIAPVGTRDLLHAVNLNMSDFEDAMQVASAAACGAGYIVTRNLRHYRRSPIQALSPSEFLAKTAAR
ncbi:MAG: PIN domain-containing protein [Deltaproteobacteria bacterium]|nr:PIN domain-containing protein [Deltaproteobacteria bacterium]